MYFVVNSAQLIPAHDSYIKTKSNNSFAHSIAYVAKLKNTHVLVVKRIFRAVLDETKWSKCLKVKS